MKKQLFIRADGNSTIGLGHIFRCLALAEMLRDLFEVSFFCQSIPASLEGTIHRSGYNLVKLDHEHAFQAELHAGVVVVLDGYHFTSAYQYDIKSTEANLVCIDDLHDRKFFADIIINHAPAVKESDYLAEPETVFALGVDFALLRQSFLKQAKVGRRVTTKNSILICFGGADPKNLTKKALTTLNSFENFVKIHLVTGAANVNLRELEALQTSRIIHSHSVDEQTMLGLMLDSDFAIVPASGILYETLAAGCNVISGFYVENQLAIYRGFKALNSFYDAGDFTNLHDTLVESIQAPMHNKHNPVDGYSGERIASLFQRFR